MPKHIDYYASLISPWTYLGSARIEALAARHGATVTIWPVDFGQVFPASGGLPLPKRAPQRQAYRMMELKRWRAHLGVPINLQPKFFPANEQPAARSVIAVRETGDGAKAIALAHAVLRGVWEEEKDISDPQTLAGIIAGIGLDPAKIAAAAESPEIMARREADTKRAIDRGVFGAPSYVIDGEIFWGQDRLDFVDRKLGS
ncbi:2-hydroxychromene-2-carboxylate isomerase [Reyranella sp. CPCC 100927]|uniref:2-hydroxychromene-2-carboxylate isomerase n=1 Tax=Reyranella sp. CPCC 100927 TaxID=2599616 RepID=UPI0011B70851|nr:2-hydroxychromene-2-carboxylate isomerase [Reyranella sp. CPCC 100927]TWT15561.1 2-hydroxychromene-2-carboxylate isomerase [Reyranella sp. CPCC 100927]